ncbi:mitogen-activated protein kinase kinase kinase 1-like [Choloepus didactylus]|uniref:mitogen-activated protein kinase kinase kinase 1-like n=1 Tax=Choloepus didactylus TaxID=27675 RepID=UPI00189FA60C|nr:mitogen-activated protein kinase kinase kinase 1-like [Choloepus didactylus]
MGWGGRHCPAGALGRSSRRRLRSGRALEKQREVAGAKYVERCNFAKSKRRSDGSNALREPEESDKVVRMTQFAVVPVSRAGRCCHRAPLDVTTSRLAHAQVGGRGGGPGVSAPPPASLPRPPGCWKEGGAGGRGRGGWRRGRAQQRRIPSTSRSSGRNPAAPASRVQNPACPPLRSVRVGGSTAVVSQTHRPGTNARLADSGMPGGSSSPALSVWSAAPPHRRAAATREK